MLAVIFKATLSDTLVSSYPNYRQDEFDHYSIMAAQLRELAFTKYGCVDFVSTTEKSQEIAISYWNSPLDITQWKEDTTHKQAQAIGHDRWYKEYSVEVVEVLKSYQHP